MTYGPATEAAVDAVLDACKKSGSRSIIALSGVPGTGKSFVASIAAQRYASDPLMVREIQFHPSFTYEEFIEGLRIDDKGAVTVMPGAFLEWNDRANDDPDHQYVLLIEELTRANLSAVLGELMTYLEYRDRPFTTVYSRRPVQIAANLTVMATYNPTDRSAIEVDSALLRRMRILSFPPSNQQLEEMLSGVVPGAVVDRLKNLFNACLSAFPDDFELLVPFGHGVFADVTAEADLGPLWEQRLRHMLRRPWLDPHPFASVIEANYPWRKVGYSVSSSGQLAASANPTLPAPIPIPSAYPESGEWSGSAKAAEATGPMGMDAAPTGVPGASDEASPIIEAVGEDTADHDSVETEAAASPSEDGRTGPRKVL